MKMAKAPKQSQSQVDKFRDLARQLEVDEDEEAFREKVRKIATAPKSIRGYWRVDFAVPHGHRANFYPEDPAASYAPSPIYATPERVREWLSAQGCKQSPDDADIWLN